MVKNRKPVSITNYIGLDPVSSSQPKLIGEAVYPKSDCKITDPVSSSPSQNLSSMQL